MKPKNIFRIYILHLGWILLIDNLFGLWFFHKSIPSFLYSEKRNISHKHKRIISKPKFPSEFYYPPFEFLLDKTSWREPSNKDITDKCKIHGPAECNQLPTCAAGYITHKIAVKILSYQYFVAVPDKMVCWNPRQNGVINYCPYIIIITSGNMRNFLVPDLF